MEDFKRIVKMKTGGSVSKAIAAYEKRERKTEEKEDVAQDKKIVKKAFSIHDTQQHEEKTDLAGLKKGGRAKKAQGTVKKYKTGGTVENAYGAKKTDKDIKDIANSKRQKPQMLCGGKSVKKMADGGILDAIKGAATTLKEKVMGTPEQNRLALEREKRIAARKAAEASGDKAAIAAQPSPTAPLPGPGINAGAGAPAGGAQDAAIPGRMKKGGKACK